MTIVFKKMMARTVITTMLTTNIAYAAPSLVEPADQPMSMAFQSVDVQSFSALQSIPAESLSHEEMGQVEGKLEPLTIAVLVSIGIGAAVTIYGVVKVKQFLKRNKANACKTFKSSIYCS